MISAVGDSDSIARSRALGADDYIIKPCNIFILKERVWNRLNERKRNKPPVDA